MDVDPRTVAHDGPTLSVPYARPEWQDDVQANHFTGSAADDSRPRGKELGRAIGRSWRPRTVMLKSWITSPVRPLYVQGATPPCPYLDGGGVVRVDENTNLGVALATDASPAFHLSGSVRGVLARPWLSRVTLRPLVHAPWRCLTA